ILARPRHSITAVNVLNSDLRYGFGVPTGKDRALREAIEFAFGGSIKWKTVDPLSVIQDSDEDDDDGDEEEEGKLMMWIRKKIAMMTR
ncbi:hypothetical protein PENTCL1PPCAC_11992, partial [Pristionchus entomophagus]